MRDLRDPEQLGLLLGRLVKPPHSLPVLNAADELPAYHIPDYDHAPTCIEKYGRPGDHEPVWERIQVK